MIKDIFDSFKDNLKERTTNPFLGTFVIVWTVRNWTLVYSLIFFDKSLDLQHRLDYINTYFKGHSFIENLFYTSVCTLLVLMFTYFLLSVSRLLVNAFDKLVTPWVYKITDKGSIVLKSDYINAQDAISSLQIKLDNERSTRIKAQEDRDLLEKKLIEAFAPKTSHDKEFSVLSEKLKSLPDTNVSLIDNFIDQVYDKTHLGKGGVIANLFAKDELLTVQEVNNNIATYSFTDKGKEFVKYWNEVHHR